MARRMDASLAVQMESLKKSMSSRDKRRNQDRLQRAAQASMEAGGRDVYDKRAVQPPNATGGIQLGPASAASAAVERAAALAGPRMIRCELCQANFVGDAQYKQHLDSAIHRKALAKEEARKQRERQLGANAGAAESAVAAAAWANGGAMGSRRQLSAQNLPQRPLAAPLPDSVEFAPPGSQQGQPAGLYQNSGSTGVCGQLRAPPPAAQQPQAGRGVQQNAGGRGRGRGRGGRMSAEEVAAAEAARQAALLSHADLVASARKDTGPLSIGGWVPPTVLQTPRLPEGEDAASDAEEQDKREEPAAALPAQQPEPAASAAPQAVPESNEEQRGTGVTGLVAYSGDDSDGSDDSDEEADASRPKFVSFF